MISRLALVATSLCLALARDALAQCPNGSPPPCTASARATPPRSLDPNRIAIVPFRVTTSDTLLGEGFAELLAAEFTGQNMPRAVDMGSVIHAWHRAGGGPRSPLDRSDNLQIARSLGAGIVSEGSIVGLGRRITITATLVNVADGKTRGEAAKIATSPDSLDAALRAIHGQLIGRRPAAVAQMDMRYTNSPEAMRSFLEGMSLWRVGRLRPAADAFDRAIALDSMFGRAVFRRIIAQSWGVAGNVQFQRAWDLRDRLAPDERMIVNALFGVEYPRQRSVEKLFADMDYVAVKLPENADALSFAGDFWYHSGAGVDPAGHVRKAAEYFERAIAIDSQATNLQHLVEIALRLRDTSMIRRAAAAYLRTEGRNRWQFAWLAAASTGDAAHLEQLRKTPVDTIFTRTPFVADMIADMPVALHDELYRTWLAATTPANTNVVLESMGRTLATHGRLTAAESAWARVATGASSATASRTRLALAIAGVDGIDPIRAEQELLRTDTVSGAPTTTRRRCLLSVSALRRGVRVPIDTTGFTRYALHCGFALAILQIPPDSGLVTERYLAQIDSALRNSIPDTGVPYTEYETRILADAWEKFGRPARALAAIRYRQFGFPTSEGPWNYYDEGRLAEKVGDREGAIRAYRYWLEITRDADPVFAPKRAAARTALTRLTGAPAP